MKEHSINSREKESIQRLLSEAVNSAMSGNLTEAIRIYKKVLRDSPDHTDALFNLAHALYINNDFNLSEDYLRKAINIDPGRPHFYFLMAQLNEASGKPDEAMAGYKKALDINPSYPEALTNLGNLYRSAGKFSQAKQCYRNAINASPDFALAHFNHGITLKQLGFPDKALECFKSCIIIDPDFSEAHNNIGMVLWETGHREKALDYFRKAINSNNNYTAAYNNLGHALKDLGRSQEAISILDRAVATDNNNCTAYCLLGDIYRETGEIKESCYNYQKVPYSKYSDGIRIKLATLLPVITESSDQITKLRHTFEHNVATLLNHKLTITDPANQIGVTNFLLAYHGENDKHIQKMYARLCIHACRDIEWTAPHCHHKQIIDKQRRIRVGFISRYFYNHSIGNTSRGIIKNLDRNRFSVISIMLQTPNDTTANYIANASDQIVILENDLAKDRQTLADLKLDILFYQDIGMDPFTYFLAFSRLAPVQCTSFGHPVTTGIPNMDYYISTNDWEPDDADCHYSEKLIRLKNVSSVAYYYKPPVPDTMRNRNSFGLGEHYHIYICPQSLFKLHPDFDCIISGILEKDTDACIIFIEGMHPQWGEKLRERFSSTINNALIDGIRFIPRLSGQDFINIIALSDVMLDTIHFCGFNTTLQAFSTGVPVVTMPGKFMRSRHTYAFYKSMNIPDCVAHDTDEYINIAVNIGTQPDLRRDISNKIRSRQNILWEDKNVISEFEKFFISSINNIILD